jgi:hypothetical protein
MKKSNLNNVGIMLLSEFKVITAIIKFIVVLGSDITAEHCWASR